MQNLIENELTKIQEGTNNLERSLLIVSGNLKHEEEVADYQKKLDKLERLSHHSLESFPYKFDRDYPEVFIKGLNLFNSLCDGRGTRFQKYVWALTDNIDNQLSQDKKAPVGNCVGLTMLYKTLCLRIGIKEENIKVLCEANNHILTRLRQDNYFVDVENMSRKGFNRTDEFKTYEEKSLDHVLYLALSIRANEEISNGNLEDSFGYLDAAIKLNPSSELALRQRALAYVECGDCEKAIADYEKIALENQDYFSFHEFGDFLEGIQDYSRAIQAYKKAMELDSRFSGAKTSLRRTYVKLGAQKIKNLFAKN